MPKLLVIEPCIINFGDDRGGVDCAAGDIVEVQKDTAAALARVNRTLYVDKKDDPDKTGRYTASAEMLKAAEAMAKKSAKSKNKTDNSAPDLGKPPALPADTPGLV